MSLTLGTRDKARGAGRKPVKKAAAPRASRRAVELRALQDLRIVVGSARQYDSRIRRSTGISGSQLWALAEIGRSAGLSVNELAARLALHQTTASNLVNALVERRLLRRSRDQHDQRVVHLFATAEGVRLLSRSPHPYSGLLVDALRRIGARDLNSLAQGLVTLRGAMRLAAPASAGEVLLDD